MRLFSVKKVIIVSGLFLLLWLIGGFLLGFMCRHNTKKWYANSTRNKLIRLYSNLIYYVEQYGNYPPSLVNEHIDNQNITDIKPDSASWGLLVLSNNEPKRIPFLYNRYSYPNQENDENPIIVAEPMTVDNMRYVIYGKYINEFLKQREKARNDPQLRSFYYEKVDDSVKRISEEEFQKQAEKQGWHIVDYQNRAYPKDNESIIQNLELEH